MPRLPDFQDLGQRPVPQAANGIASYEPSPRRFGQGITSAGKEIEAASMIVAETNQRQDVMVAEDALNRLKATGLDLAQGEQGFQKMRGAQAVGKTFLESYEQRFKSAATDIESTLQNENQRRLFQQRVPVAGMQYRSALLSHQAQETDKFNATTENNTVDFARRQIFENPNDPGALAAGFTQIDWAIDQKAKREGWAPVTIEETKAKFKERVYEDTAAILVERDPAGSLAALNRRLGVGTEAGLSGIPAFDNSDPQKLIQLRSRANSYVEVAKNKQEAENKKRLTEAEAATTEAQNFFLTGQMPSPQYERELVAKVAGTPFEPVARQMIAQSYMGVTHGSVPLAEQEARIRTLDAALNAIGSSPEQVKLAQAARTITNNQRTAYKENPWAAATRFGRQPAEPEQQITAAAQVPQLVAQRLPLMTGVELFASEPVSPLQPGEAKAFAAHLQTLQPGERAEVLGQTGAMLTAPRVQALADQLDKHDKPTALALKMGLDRTSAGRAVSTLVLRGAQALADKTVKKDETALSGWRAEIAEMVRGTLGDQRAEQDAIDAAYYVRAGLEQEGSAAVGFKSMSASAESAMAMVIGKPMERAGVKSFLPRGMLKESDFDEKLRTTYTPERLTEMAPAGLYVRGVPVKPEAVANRITQYGLRYAGRGSYVPSVNNAPITLDPQGMQPLVLEVK